MRKRVLVAALVISAAFALPTERAHAAGSGGVSPSARVAVAAVAPVIFTGGYIISATTCVSTSATTTSCGLVAGRGLLPRAWGQPSQIVFGCATRSNGQLQQVGWVSTFSPGFFGSGSVFGTAGLNSYSPPYAEMASFLAGWSNANYSFYGGGTGFTSGQTAGFVTVNNTTQKVVAGNIGISVSGAILARNPATGQLATTQGSLSCAVSPNTGTNLNHGQASPNGGAVLIIYLP